LIAAKEISALRVSAGSTNEVFGTDNRRSLKTLSAVAAVLILAALSAEAEEAPSLDPVHQEIWQLRLQAKYDEAIGPARLLLALRQENPDAKPYEIADAETLVRTLQQISSLPDDAQRELALADSLTEVDERCWEEGRYAEAAAAVRRQLEIRRRRLSEDHLDVATSLNSLAMDLYAEGDYAGAEPLLREALAMSKRLLGNEHPDVAASLGNLAALHEAQGDYVGADTLLEEAARVYGAARLRAGTGLKRATFQESPYPHLASVRLSLGRPDEAWPAAEKAHAQSLAELLMVASKRELSSSESAREDSLRSLLGQLQDELGAYVNAAQSDTAGETVGLVEGTRSALLAAEAEWSSFERDIAEKHPVTEGEAYSLERVQSALPKHAAIVGWLDVERGKGDYDSWCYAIRSSRSVIWARATAPSGAGASCSPFGRSRSLRDALADPGSTGTGVTRDCHDLWRERIEPLLAALNDVSELVVIPSGAMRGVPVEALVDDERVPVGETYAVSYAPSATIYTWLSERTAGEAGGATLLVGDPPYTVAQLAEMEREQEMQLASAERMLPTKVLRSALAGNEDALAALPRLPGARRGVAGVAEISGQSTVLLGPEATEQELVRLAEGGKLGRFAILHIATHALVDDDRPERSALVLSQVDLPDPLEAAMAGTRIYDGLVTAEEILSEWDLTADLVTLSACETGLGREVAGEGYVGFAHALLQAGARSLLVSLWKADDRATSLLMRRFYVNLFGRHNDNRAGRVAEPMPKADALREAKLWLRTSAGGANCPYAHPYYWSGFVLIGDPS
jgi:CHAT domain-containing protein/tetratricopeptide (TPR) repeat protein